MKIRPITTEKAVKLIDLENTLVFEVDSDLKKPEIKKRMQDLFSVKIISVRTHKKANKKFAYVKLAKENPAIDIATKLGII